MRKLISVFLATALLAGFATSASAGRTVIDQNPDGTTAEQPIGGYCDVDLLECGPVSLGYTVDFGQGALSDVIFYGNALISFGTGVVPLLGPDGVSLADINSLADYGSTVVSPGLENFLVIDFDQSSSGDKFPLIGRLVVDPLTGTIRATFEDCTSTNFCFLPNSSLTLTPTAGGYQVLSTNNYDRLAGFALADGTVNEQIGGSRSFFIPAKFEGLTFDSAVPEPATWTMMLLGFGFVGGAMRSAKRRQKPVLSYA